MDGAISIGRNIGDKPMHALQWRRFIVEVENAVQTHGKGIIYATAKGSGEWEGISEDNAVITFGNVTEIAVLKEWLSQLAKKYHQDAIALVLGQSELVGS